MSDNRPCDIFISYSRDSGDKAAEQLGAAIEKQGIQPFRFDYTLRSGDVWNQEVLDALRFSRCVMVLVPAKDKKLTDYMNHEIGIAHVLKKTIVPVALGDDFSSSAPMSDMLSHYWGRPLNQLLSNLDSFIRDLCIDVAARRTLVWSHYLVSDSARIVVGSMDPRKLNNPEQVPTGDYLSIGNFRSGARLLCFFSQEFGVDFANKLLIARDLSDDEISRHDLIILGGPHSLQASPLQAYHEQLGIRFADDQRAYLIGPKQQRIVTKTEPNGIKRQGCVLCFARSPMNRQREILLVSGVSGYGCQGAIEYLVGTQIDPELAKTVDQWRRGPRDTPLLFEISTEFKGHTSVQGSGVARPIEGNSAT